MELPAMLAPDRVVNVSPEFVLNMLVSMIVSFVVLNGGDIGDGNR